MRAYWYFLRLLRKEWYGVLAGIAMSFIASFASISLMGTALWFLSAMAVAGATDMVLNIFVPSALIRLLALARTLLRYGERYVTHDATFKIVAWLRVFLVERVMSLEYEQAVQLNNADIQRRMHVDTEKLEMIYVRELVPFVCAVLIGLVWTAVLLSFSITLACIALVLFLIAAFVVPFFVMLKVQHLSLEQSTLSEALHAKLNKMLSGFIDLILLQQIGPLAKDVLDQSQALARARARMVFYDQALQCMVLLCAELSFVLVLLFGYPLVIAGEISGPQLMMLGVVALAVYEVVVPLGVAYVQLAQVIHAAQRIVSLLSITEQNAEVETVEESNGPSVVVDTQTDPQECVVRLDQVGFYWDVDKRVVLDQCSYSFSSTQNYLLQAPSGSGKSTLVLLLTGLVSPKSGALYLNTRAYSLCNKALLRTHFATLQQDTVLFAGTLRECFTKVKPQVSESEILELLSFVELQDFVLQLPQGLDEYLGPTGFNLSGGQARRLALARTLLMEHADFLLLDEVGEGLDLKQEERILLRLLQRRRGLIIISHRMLSHDLFDHCITLHQGQLIEVES